MYKLRTILFGLLLVACPVTTAQIVINTPSAPIARGGFSMVSVQGINQTDLAQCKVLLTPNDGKVFYVQMPTQPLGPITYVIFVSPDAAPGKRTFSISHHLWRASLSETVSLLEGSGIDPEDANKIRELSESLGQKYKYFAGSAILEVGGSSPPPPGPDPDDPIVPGQVTGPLLSIIISQSDQIPVGQVNNLLQLRDWADQQPPDKFQQLEFSNNPTLGDGSVDARIKSYIDKIPAGKQLPYVFLVRALKGGGSHIYWQGEIPAYQTLIDEAKKHL